ncbi:hypothetical protein AURDEDRAFT_77399, partial [Auricularia subglabra TFB-10046 SS5]
MREVALSQNKHFIVDDGLPIAGVVEELNNKFNTTGRVPGGEEHHCSECVQPYIPPPPELSGDAAATYEVTARVIDGIVMGPCHCTFDDCIEPLLDAAKGVCCKEHHELYAHLCHVKGCSERIVKDTRACAGHQREWRQHQERFARQSVLGMRR